MSDVTWADLPISPDHAVFLSSHAVTAEVAGGQGIRSVTELAELPEAFGWAGERAVPAILFPWRTPSGVELYQLRPDSPIEVDGEDRPRKYLWPKGCGSPIGVVREDVVGPVLMIEGTKQSLAAAGYLSSGAVYAIAGCRSWSRDGVPEADLHVVAGRDVVVAFDADLETNPDVWDAGAAFQRALKAEGPASIRWMRVPGGKKSGLDDVLGRREEDRRASYLAALVEQAEVEKFPRSRRPKPSANPDSVFGDNGLRVELLASKIFDRHPSALTREDRVALYSGGVFRSDGVAFTGAVVELLGDDYRPSHRDAVEEFTVGVLHNAGRRLPDRIMEPLLNVRNGMLDLATGTLKPHDPAYLSSVQFPVEWDPEALCPTYDAWIAATIPEQVEDLEEAASAMLDPSQTPSKAVFLFGPARSGKSTFLRIMQAVAGPENTSGVNLGQLADNRFAAAAVFGKALNVSADLSSAHVEDLSLFKMMTGEDLIQADRKYGHLFAFVNRALFAFSANELPTVGESSRAYAERVKPFRFSRSFAGHEDPSIEAAMLAELPGILVRWVRAWQRRAERGAYLPTSASVREEFETRSDRVRQWVSEAMTVTEANRGDALRPDQATTKTALARMFREWAKDNGGASLPTRKITDRLATMPGVVEVRIGGAGSASRGLNIAPRKSDMLGSDGGMSDSSSAVSAVSTPLSVDRENTKKGPVDELRSSVLGEDGSETAETAEDLASSQVRTPVSPSATPDPKLPRTKNRTDPHMTTTYRASGIKWTPAPDPSQSPVAAVLEHAVPTVPRPYATCPVCEGDLTPVPPHDLWSACRSCHPGTFTRV